MGAGLSLADRWTNMKLVTFCRLAPLGIAYNFRDEENDIFVMVSLCSVSCYEWDV